MLMATKPFQVCVCRVWLLEFPYSGRGLRLSSELDQQSDLDATYLFRDLLYSVTAVYESNLIEILSRELGKISSNFFRRFILVSVD